MKTPSPIQSNLSTTQMPAALYHNPQVKWGGVKNGGTTCSLSAFIQEMAMLPSYYTPFLTVSLDKTTNETSKKFENRSELQQLLLKAVHKVENGETVKQREVHKIVRKILDLKIIKGWSHSWKRHLYRLAPNLFSLPTVDMKEVYAFILSQFPAPASDVDKIAFIYQEKKQPLAPLIEEAKNDSVKLFRVTRPLGKEKALQRTLNVQDTLFNLKLVHVVENYFFSKHIVTYRPLDDGSWLYCNDSRVRRVKHLPKRNLYTLLYETV